MVLGEQRIKRGHEQWQREQEHADNAAPEYVTHASVPKHAKEHSTDREELDTCCNADSKRTHTHSATLRGDERSDHQCRNESVALRILHRAKRGFGTPMGAWLRKELLAVVRELLSPAVVRRRGLFDDATVSELLADHEAQRSDGTDVLLALLNLEVWSRIYLDGREPADVADELQKLARGRREPAAMHA